MKMNKIARIATIMKEREAEPCRTEGETSTVKYMRTNG